MNFFLEKFDMYLDIKNFSQFLNYFLHSSSSLSVEFSFFHKIPQTIYAIRRSYAYNRVG